MKINKNHIDMLNSKLKLLKQEGYNAKITKPLENFIGELYEAIGKQVVWESIESIKE